MSACKVAAVVCTAALATGGAVEVRQLSRHHRESPAPTKPQAAARVAAPAAVAPAAHRTGVFAPVPERVVDQPRRRQRTKPRAKPVDAAPVTPVPIDTAPSDDAAPVADGTGSGGVQAPEAPVEEPAGGSGTAPEGIAEAPATAPPPAEVTGESGAGDPPAEPSSGPSPTEH